MNFKIEMNRVAEKELGYRMTKKTNWIVKETEELHTEIRLFKEINTTDKNGNEKKIKLKELRKQLKKELTKDKNNMLKEIATELEEACKRGDSKKHFAGVN